MGQINFLKIKLIKKYLDRIELFDIFIKFNLVSQS
jgi:hypothetical protein